MSEEALRKVLAGVLGRRAVPASGEVVLADAGLDSMGMIELLAAIESTFDVRVDPEDITPENFRTLSSLNAYLTARRSAS